MQKVASLHALGAIRMKIILKIFPCLLVPFPNVFNISYWGFYMQPSGKTAFLLSIFTGFSELSGNLSDCVWLGNIENIMDTFARGWQYLYNLFYLELKKKVSPDSATADHVAKLGPRLQNKKLWTSSPVDEAASRQVRVHASC
jgi:hypothetical protein